MAFNYVGTVLEAGAKGSASTATSSTVRNPSLSDWRPYLLISFVLLRLLRFSSARSWSKRRLLSTDYCFLVKIQSREHWWTIILAFQENGCWWNSVIMSVIMTDAVTEWEDSSLLPAAAPVTPHSTFTWLHQLHQTHFKYVHIEKKLETDFWLVGRESLFLHTAVSAVPMLLYETWNYYNSM